MEWRQMQNAPCWAGLEGLNRLNGLRGFIATAAIPIALAYGNSAAATGLAANEPWLRHDLQALKDANYLQTLTTTWPIAWPQLQHALAALDAAALPPHLALAHARLTRYGAEHTRPLQYSLAFRGSNEPPLATTIAPHHSEQISVAGALDFSTASTAGKIQVRVNEHNDDDR